MEENEPNTLGFHHLFHADIFWYGGFDCYNFDRIHSRENFIKCFEKQITEWHDAYKLQCLDVMREIRVVLSDEEAKVDQTEII